jgi:hypothetical protein
MIRLRRILFEDYRGLLPIAPTLALAPIGLAMMLWVRLRKGREGQEGQDRREQILVRRRRHAAIVASIIAVYFILLNASYVYWEGGWSYGPRHASPAIPFLCIGLAVLWTAVPAIGRVVLAALSLYGTAITLIAVSTMPLPPANIRHPVQDFLWPAFRDGDLSLNSQTMAAGGVDTNFRAHHEPPAAFNLGMKLGLRGHASLAPLAIVWIACGVGLIAGASATRRAAAAATMASATSPESPASS